MATPSTVSGLNRLGSHDKQLMISVLSMCSISNSYFKRQFRKKIYSLAVSIGFDVKAVYLQQYCCVRFFCGKQPPAVRAARVVVGEIGAGNGAPIAFHRQALKAVP